MAASRTRNPRRVRTPTVLQMESTECGAASLGIILSYFGRIVPLAELRVDCGVSRDGSNALFIKKTAEKYGLIGKGYQLTVDDLRTLKPPFMVFWDLKHFLVVEGFGRGRVYLNDPATGRRAVSDEAFRRSYTGIAFRFEPGPNFRKGGTRPSAWAGLGRRIAGARLGIAFVVLAGAAIMAADVVGAAFPLIFVDQLLIEGRYGWIRPLVLAMAVTALFRLVALATQRRALLRLGRGLATVHSSRFVWHVLRLPIAFYQQRYAGDVSGRVDSNSSVADILSGELATTIVGLIMIAFYAAVMWAFDPLLAALGVVFGMLNLLGIAAVSRHLADENLKLKQNRGQLDGSLMRALQIIETIKANTSESEALVHLTGHQARVTSAAQAVGKATNLMIVMPPLLATAGTAAILGIGGGRVMEGVLSVGALVAFQTLMGNFNRPFADLVRLGSTLQSLQAELGRLNDVLHYKVDPAFGVASGPGAERGTPPAPALVEGCPQQLSGHLEIRSVSFGFNRTLAEPLIQRFSLEIKPGRRVALVGDSGSGKSTIGRLVAGLYRPWEGEILYDGRRIDEIPRAVFTDQVALVDDEHFVFDGTVRDNLSLWDDTISDHDIQRAAMDAEIHRDLLVRRGGYNAQVAEGARNLSGGQRQRLEIARALVRNPALIVLDEATSALDPITEALVDDHIRRRGCTCLIIAHRLSTIRDCDEIIVLRQGRVVQRGTHDSLMADAGGFYHELQSLQERALEQGDEEGGDGPGRRRELVAARAPRDAIALLPALAAAPGRDERDDWTAHHQSNGRGAVASYTPDRIDCETELVQTAANLPVALDDAGAVWQVVSGRLDLFHVEEGAGDAEGRRRHLCRVEEGGSIFAMAAAGGAHGALVGVGAGPARLRKFTRDDLDRACAEPGRRQDFARMIDEWVDGISRSIVPAHTPIGARWMEEGEAFSTADGARIVPRNEVLWVREAESSSRFVDVVRVPACPRGSRFPLSHHAWLTIDGAGTLDAVSTEDLLKDQPPWTGLERFHAVVLNAIANARAAETAKALARRGRSAERDAAMVEGALDDLCAQATGRPLKARHEGHPLLDACRLVGAAQGITVKAPGVADADDPLRIIARASAFRTRRVRLAVDWWKNNGGPLLGFMAADGAPVALLQAGNGKYTLVDPGRKQTVPVTAEVAATLSPAGVMFYRTLPAGRLTARDLIRFSLPVIRKDLGTLLAMGLFAGLLGLVAPYIVGMVIDDVIPQADRGQLGMLCGILIALGLAIASFQFIQSVALVRINGRLESTLLPAAWDRLLSLPVGFFRNHTSGALALRMNGLARVVELFVSTWIASLFMSLFSLVNLLVLYAYSARLAIIATAFMAVVLVVDLVIVRPFWRCKRLISRAQGEISTLMLHLLGGVSRLRVAGAERRAFARWAEKYRRQLTWTMGAQKVVDRMLVFAGVWPLVLLMVVFMVVIDLGPAAMSAGQFMAFNLALGQAIAAVLGVGFGMLTLTYGLEQYERFRPILKAEPEVGGLMGDVVTLRGAIRVGGLSFRYHADDPMVLDSVDIQVRPGEFVAIVGPSGSGKSTLLRLLLGFETPSEGLVAYEGRDMRTLDHQEVRRQLGVVLQDAQVRPGDIYANIVGNAANLTKDDAWEAARLADLDRDIEQMPMGMHTVVSEGRSGLSSGQRQRLLIARALVGRPKVILFDEATSALDNHSQSAIFENIRSKRPGTTVLTIAHRLSTVVNADRIYVLKGGKIVQSGTYSQLIHEPGPFQELARRQSLVAGQED